MITCKCGGRSHVTDTRPLDDGIWRRRECKVCGVIFTTFEQHCETPALRKGKPAGSTKDKPLQPATRKIVKPKPVVITAAKRSQPPGRRSKKSSKEDKPYVSAEKDMPALAAVALTNRLARHQAEDRQMEKELDEGIIGKR